MLPGSDTRSKRPAFAPRTVIAYHGCSEDIAEKIIAEGRLLPSTNTYDWLGEGVYFWEYAPAHAFDWANSSQSAKGGKAAVIGATIKLGRCLNLLDSASAPNLKITYDSIAGNLGSRRLPRNTDRGAYYLDREVIDTYCSLSLANEKYAYQTVRGCYPEGEPIYPGSKILSLAHVQIAVRDPVCISNLFRVRLKDTINPRNKRS